MNKQVINHSAEFNGQKITLKTGDIAFQANAAVMVSVGETTILATVVSKEATAETDFFPLKIDYEERFYAGGIIGGNRFSRREGKPNDDAIVSARLIDHAIRPLFAKDFMNETQLVLTVLSIDKINDPVLVAFMAASAVFSISGMPFSGPISAIRINRINNELKFGFNYEHEESDMGMVVSYLDEGKKVQALEAHGHIIPETEVIAALNAGATYSAQISKILKDFADKCAAPTNEYKKSWLNKDSVKEFEAIVMPQFMEWRQKGIEFRGAEWEKEKALIHAKLAPEFEGKYTVGQVKILIDEVEKYLIRDLVLKHKTRIDGRGFDEIRELSAQTQVIPRVHGSALFNRGLTQSLTLCTLASSQYKQLVQGIDGETEKTYMHHYNFPPYSTGEMGNMGGANRRAVGHGLLAEKALVAVLPDTENFPYAMRLVSEILSSNGSTSMAATCASSLSLMDAGVPIKAHVGGIGVGLFVDTANENPQTEDFIILTDIMGVEDFAGYMDFKLTGTRQGMTAIQLELKLKGLPIDLFAKIFEISRNARMKVLDVMDAAISEPRKTVSEFAPRIKTIKIDRAKVGMVIGSGGSVIKEIIEETGCEVDISETADYALVTIAGFSDEGIKAAADWVLGIVTDIEVGDVMEGVVVRVENYGAFVKLTSNKDGLLHVSEISNEYVQNVADVIKLGDKIKVKVIGTENGKISVSKKALQEA